MKALVFKELNCSKRHFLISSVIYALAFIYVDTFGFIFLLSAIGITDLLLHNVDEDIIIIRSNRKLHIIYFIVSVFISFLCMFLFISGYSDNGISVNGINILPSLSILPLIVIPIIWIQKHERINIYKLFRFNRRILLLVAMICLPIMISDLVTINGLDLYTFNETALYFNIYQTFIIAAFIEELFFRGFLYSLLKRLISKNVAMFLSSFVFTAWHLNLLISLYYQFTFFVMLNICAIFILGVVSAYIYERSRSLIPSIILHAVINGGFKYCIILILLMNR